MRALLICFLVSVGCGSVSDNSKHDAPPMCVPETDTEFCTRLAKTCDPFSGMDNCNQARTANCGTCSGATPTCSSNTCVPPVCGTSFSGTAGVAVPNVNTAGKQSALLGASASGGNLLYLAATGTCVGAGANLVIADEAVAGTPPYTLQTIGGLASLAGFVRTEETMTLSADGLTIVGVGTDNRSFLQSSRSALGLTDFSTAAVGPFATLNGALPAAPATVSWPVLSHDGLEFTFRVGGATNTALNGIYDSVRSSTMDAFPAATKLTGDIATYDAISGLSSDRLTAFVEMSFGTKIVTRASLTAPFTNPATSSPPFQAFRVIPIAGCATLVGTSEPGGCQNEAISTWAKM